MPCLSVRAAPPRFGAVIGATGRAGNDGLNMRGLQGNQVLMRVDGIRVPSSFSFGGFATGRADYLTLEATQAADVLRGPASTQFGSDGLGGAISLRTLDPSSVLKPGLSVGSFVRRAGAQVDGLIALTAAAALRQGPWEALLLADAVARTVLQPADVPLGGVTALIGVPFFFCCCCVAAMGSGSDPTFSSIS